MEEQAIKRRASHRKAAAPQKRRSGVSAVKKLKLLVTVVNRNKAEFYADLLEGLEVNMQLTMHASGTATSERLHVLGLEESDKSVIFSIVREDRAADALRILEQKFASVRGGKGIAYTVPLSCTMGVAIYSFLANAKEAAKEERK